MPESLSGSVERVTFFNEENGFAVLRVKIKGRPEAVTCLCALPAVHAGEWLEAEGAWLRDPIHGLQFKATSAHASAPTSRASIERYLGQRTDQGHRRGLRQETGREIRREDFRRDRKRIRAARGNSRASASERRKAIKAAWAEQRHVREIMLFLYAHGAGTARAQRIFKTYGEKSIEIVREDPYRLARDIHGIGFRTADEIASRIGIAPHSARRALAGLRHVLQEAAGAEGHSALPLADLIARAEKLLGVSATSIASALADGVTKGDFIEDRIDGETLVYLPHLHAAEIAVARRVRALAEAPSTYPEMDIAKATAWAEKQSGRELSPSQREALRTLLSSRIAVLTGGPGVGKTTLLDAFLRIVVAKKISPVLCAPTGRAAQRLTAATGRPAKTIHRLLEARGAGGFQRGPGSSARGRALRGGRIVHARSPALRRAPARAARRRVAPAGGRHGSIALGRTGPRPAPAHRERTRAHRAADGDFSPGGVEPDRRQRPSHQRGRAAGARAPRSRQIPISLSSPGPRRRRRRRPSWNWWRSASRRNSDSTPRRDIQVLCPMNRGPCGTRELNRLLQSALNPPREDGGMGEVERFGWTFRVGDRVIQTENNYDKEVFNGDIGTIARVEAEEREVAVEFENRKSAVRYDFGELDQLAPAYAITVHKSQGSEFPAVVIPIVSDQFLLLQRNLLYTAVTRGRRLVVVVAQTRALQRAVRETGARRARRRAAARLTGVDSRRSTVDSQND